MAERKQRIDPEVRAEEIATAARALFSEKGIGRTSIKDVAERAGIARGLDLNGLKQELKCGTSCGSCVPEIKRLLVTQPVAVSA